LSKYSTSSPNSSSASLSHLLKTISKQPLDMNYFSPDNNLPEREINVGFSGGEKSYPK
jgi:Fe-S cluster assembly ATPase SufC